MKCYYDGGDYEGMRSKCKSIKWDEVLSGDTIDEQWKSLKDEFNRHRMVGSCNRHKGKIPLDNGKYIWRPMIECIMQHYVRLEIRSVK